MGRDYWWPGAQHFMREYVWGCAKCQENKADTHLNKPPLQPISLDPQAHPFLTIAVDFIVKLPKSRGYDLVLTIINHDCTKLVILLPCHVVFRVWMMISMRRIYLGFKHMV